MTNHDEYWAAIRAAEARMPLRIPFPLRSDFIAYVEVPRDIRETEALRLAEMVRTLASSPVERTP